MAKQEVLIDRSWAKQNVGVWLIMVILVLGNSCTFVISTVEKDRLGVVNVKFEFSGILKREGNKKIRSSLFMVVILVGMQKKHGNEWTPKPSL